jgi:hypothetical protein
MVAVRMVKLAVDQIVDVIPVGHRLVATAWTVFVLRVMPRLLSRVTTPFGVRLANRKDVFLYSIALLMAQMTVLQIIEVAIVFNRRVTATGTMGIDVLRHNNLRGNRREVTSRAIQF